MGQFLTYYSLLDAGAAVLVMALLAVFAVDRMLTFAPPLAGVVLLLLLAYPFVPFFLMQTPGSTSACQSLPVFYCSPEPGRACIRGRTARLMLMAVAVAFVVRMAVRRCRMVGS